jgi:hypothetical protein
MGSALQERQRLPRRNNAAPNGDFAKMRPKVRAIMG